MRNTIGSALTVTLFGESHGKAIGAIIDGLAPGLSVDTDFIKHYLSLRRPYGLISTARHEADNFQIDSGVYNGKTTGAPLCIRIENTDTRSGDYSELAEKMRPGHADYTSAVKYNGFSDPRGGGHFSGRITAALVAAAAVILPALQKKRIFIGTHILSCAGISDRGFSELEKDISELSSMSFPVFDADAAEKMHSEILSAKAQGDSVGGILETAVCGLPPALGEPWFDSVESLIAHAAFSVPAVKGIEFGAGFRFAEMRGSEANDAFYYDENGFVKTKTNNNGGINGGITNGMPIIFRCAVKPTPTISKPQATVNIKSRENTRLSVSGRHDPCIVHRARAVIDSVSALVVADMLAIKFGTDWLAK